MPHKCLNCEKVFDDEANELIQGCECGSKLFMYMKSADAVNSRTDTSFLKKDTILREIDSFLRKITKSMREKETISFDLESIKVLQDGIYEINVKRLMEEVPLIVEFNEGSYKIHLASAFSKGRLERFSIKELELEIPLEAIKKVSTSVPAKKSTAKKRPTKQKLSKT